jgi:hypothetical protein
VIVAIRETLTSDTRRCAVTIRGDTTQPPMIGMRGITGALESSQCRKGKAIIIRRMFAGAQKRVLA